MHSKLPTFLIYSLVVCGVLSTANSSDDSYDRIKVLQEAMLSSGIYSTELRPIEHQTRAIVINVSFFLVAVVAVDDVKQELITNGFVFLFWDDERSSWNASDYGGYSQISPIPSQIWRPRLMVINTLGKRDPFEDDYSYTSMNDDGHTAWGPGGLFNTYCALDLEKYPFDVQQCSIQLCPICHTNTRVQFRVAADDVNLAFYYPNPGWKLLKAGVTLENISVVPGEIFSCPTFNLKLQRRSTTIVLNVILPVIFLSVLNNLVFLIPVDSGEKISYAITVLLSLSVFLSMVSTMTPQVSDVIPALTIYLFVLLLSSVLTVAAAILTVYLHHMDEKEEVSINAKVNYQHAVTKFINVKKAVSPMNSDTEHKTDQSMDDIFPRNKRVNTPRRNNYRIISKHINKIFFLFMNILWSIMTIWYFAFTNS